LNTALGGRRSNFGYYWSSARAVKDPGEPGGEETETPVIRFECDKCGVPLGPGDGDRFIVLIEAYAAAEPIEFSADDLTADRSEEWRSLVTRLHRADPDELEDQTYRRRRFDLCPPCHRNFLRHPLGTDD